MKTKVPIFLLILIFAGPLFAQQQPYSVTRAPFSTDAGNEFAPVFYNNGVVFCMMKGKTVTNDQGQGLVKIYYADTATNNSSSSLFSRKLKTKLNDGPVTFNRAHDTVYLSRNLYVEGSYNNLSTSRNKLGLFYAVSEAGGWTKMRDIRFNNEWYNLTMPCLSPDGKRLYFVSDKPDGFGGFDIYYCERRNDYWDNPVNLGPMINTEGNETYPFINESGDLFFSSDGRKGLGGKDIYVARQHGDGWYPPVRLSAPVNSEYDDFGIVTDAFMNEGYFSSNREKTFDIFRFKTNIHEVWFSEPQKLNQYCFMVSDTGAIQVDTTMLRYVWDFGDGLRTSGTHVMHCFPGPGKYSIKLDINEKISDRLFFRKLTYDIEIVDYNQPYISAPDYIVEGTSVEFDALKSYCPGFEITGYFWEFGDGTQKTEANPSHTYSRAGEYTVRLGLMLQSEKTGEIAKKAVTKNVRVFGSNQAMIDFQASLPSSKPEITDLRQFENVIIGGRYSAEEELKKEAVFHVEVVSSKTKLDLTNPVFRNVPAKYSVSEVHYPESEIYSYVIDDQMSLMAALPAYYEMINSGYRDAVVKLFVIEDPAVRELHILKRNYGVMTDIYFDERNKIVTNAYLMLDQLVGLMNKYPDKKLEIGVHTDNQGTASNLLKISQTRADVIKNYLISRGINNDRLSAKGYGGTRPVSSNAIWQERRMNRRIDFKIL